jgi:formamidopyrimidine-DNA glycosylase
MPELPEVENFRRLLLPLVSKSNPLSIRLVDPANSPKRKFISQQDVDRLNNQVTLIDVQRKGKLICMILSCIDIKRNNSNQWYLFLHMGMTGRISTPNHIPRLESLNCEENYPPKHTYLVFSCETREASFSDPRKFGSVILQSSQECEYSKLAPDALEVSSNRANFSLERLIGQSTSIKSILLDQTRVMSGVGNWIADEVLYQSHIHPNQRFLSEEMAEQIMTCLHTILVQAIDCLEKDIDFPSTWIFNVRWNKRAKTMSGAILQDATGHDVEFITSGGRSTAIVPFRQRLLTTTRNPNVEPVHNDKNDIIKSKSISQGPYSKRSEESKREDADDSSDNKTNTSKKSSSYETRSNQIKKRCATSSMDENIPKIRTKRRRKTMMKGQNLI